MPVRRFDLLVGNGKGNEAFRDARTISLGASRENMVPTPTMQRIISALLFVASIPVVPMTSKSADAAAPPTFTVNSLSDVPADFTNDPNYDICRTNVMNTTCTLRAAIMNANRYVGGGATINIPAGIYRLTTLRSGTDDDSTGDLNITNTMTINGASAASTTIDGNQIDRVFNVGSGTAVTISGMTIRNGLTFDVGGGISNTGTLTLNACVISDSQSGVGSSGGGIANLGTLMLNTTLVSGNRAGGNAGGVYNDNLGVMTVEGSVISGNQTLSAGYGGGIGNSGTMTLDNSLVSDNHATGKGGGIANFAGTLTQTNCTLNNNSADSDGGAIYSASTVTMTDSTITANGARGSGGGIYQDLGTVELFSATVAGNIADSDSTGAASGGGIFRSTRANANQIWNSMFVENYDANVPNDCGGDSLTSEDYNYIQTIGTGGSCTITGTTAHNITGGDALLDALQDNGGPTPTRALFVGSPAIDQIPPALCRDAFGTAPFPDQRGVPRPVGPLCDIGAFEGAVPIAVFGRNLVRNGGAENGAGSLSGAFIGVPNWQSRGGQLLTVVPYGAPGFPSVGIDNVPPVPGRNFFAGGNSAVAVGVQDVDVSPFAASIDAGTAAFDFSADLGGYSSQDDNASVEADFLDGLGHLLTLTTLEPVTAADRNNLTGFLHRDATGMVPAQTRTVELFLTLTRVSTVGNYNDGYADNLSLVLNSTVPTPTATLSPSASPTVTGTPTSTATPTPSATATSTRTPTFTGTATPPATPSASMTIAPTRTPTQTPTGSSTATPIPSFTPTSTPTSTAIGTPTATATTTAPSTPTATFTGVRTPTASGTVTATSNRTASPTATPTTTPPTPIAICVGDCNGDHSVAVEELLTLATVALGNAGPSSCPHGIPAGAQVDVRLIIQAVNNLMNGCA